MGNLKVCFLLTILCCKFMQNYHYVDEKQKGDTSFTLYQYQAVSKRLTKLYTKIVHLNFEQGRDFFADIVKRFQFCSVTFVFQVNA